MGHRGRRTYHQNISPSSMLIPFWTSANTHPLTLWSARTARLALKPPHPGTMSFCSGTSRSVNSLDMVGLPSTCTLS